MDRIMEETLHPGTHTGRKDDHDDDIDGTSTTPTEPPEEDTAQGTNKGNLILDATCAPADIKYPTDLNLLNEAREKLDEIIDHQHQPLKGIIDRPRTYRMRGKKQYLDVAKTKKPGKKKRRRGIRQQLEHVKRNPKAVDKLLLEPGSEPLTDKQTTMLETIRTLYQQQETMFKEGTHRIDNRIVSLHQPHVRPIVRGKVKQPTEFGAKVSISVVNGYTYLERISWDNFNESADLIPAVEGYRERHGCYPEAVIADQIYRTRKNISYCKEKGIRISGPALGRKNNTLVKLEKKLAKIDSAIRNEVEGIFGTAKRSRGLDRVMAKLKETAETAIYMSFYVMNLEKKLRVLLRLFTETACFWLRKPLYALSELTGCYIAA